MAYFQDVRDAALHSSLLGLGVVFGVASPPQDSSRLVYILSVSTRSMFSIINVPRVRALYIYVFIK